MHKDNKPKPKQEENSTDCHTIHKWICYSLCQCFSPLQKRRDTLNYNETLNDIPTYYTLVFNNNKNKPSAWYCLDIEHQFQKSVSEIPTNLFASNSNKHFLPCRTNNTKYTIWHRERTHGGDMTAERMDVREQHTASFESTRYEKCC